MENDEEELNIKRISIDVKVSQDVINFTRTMSFSDKICLNMIVMNLLACVRKGNKLSYPRNKNVTPRNKKKISVRHIIKAIDFLVESGMVYNVIGNSSKLAELRTMSYISPTQDFISAWDTTFEYEDAEMKHLDASQVIILRDKDKNDIPYVRTPEIIEMEKAVHAINEVNTCAIITDGNGKNLVNIYTRIFNEDFNHGGRYYRGDVLQLKHRDTHSRLDITINEESVVEIDYSNLHFRIAAVMNGINPDSLPDDVYSGIIDDYTNRVDRRIVKLAVNIMFNATSESKALRAIQQTINSLSTDEKTVFNLGSCRTVVARIKRSYPQFVPYFCRGDSSGLELQCLESKLATSVLMKCVEEELPCLPVHDSFIVEWFTMETLAGFMKESFQELFNVNCRVPLVASWKLGDDVCETPM